MKSKINSMLALLAAWLIMANAANAQWTSNGNKQTYATNKGDSVGIGTVNPVYKLDIRATSNATIQCKSTNGSVNLFLDRSATSFNSLLNYKTTGTSEWQTGMIGTSNFNIRNVALSASAITCLVSNNYVGIGISTPTERLHVAGNILATGDLNGVNVTASGNLSGADFTATGNLNVSGYIGFGSVEQLTDGGSNTIASNSNIVPTVDCGANLGTSNKRWNNILACGNIGLGITAPVCKLHITGGTDGNLSTGGYAILGDLTGLSTSFDNKGIIARNNGVVSTLFLNNSGGNVVINGAAANTGKLGIGTSAPAVTMHIVHGNGSGANQGLRIQNSGINNHSWTLYTQNTLNRLDLCYNGSATAMGTFDGISGLYTSLSDIKFKKNLELVGDVLPNLERLQLLKYNFKTQKEGERKYMGMIAQEVQKLFPEIVYENNTDAGESFYTMDYSAFGLIAIKAIQEQQKEITELKQIVKQLDQSLAQCCMSYGEKSVVSGSIATDAAHLEQNAPNPFSEKTIVNFYIPQNFKSAVVKFYSMTGEEMKSFVISAPGLGQAEISGNSMASGVYQYTLLIDGKAVDSKQMILTK